MVDTTISDTDRRRFHRVLRVGFVALIGLSSALIAINGGGSLTEIGIVTVAGSGFGVGLLTYFSWADWAVATTRK